MDIFAFSAADFMSFLLTFLRCSIMIFLLPFYGGEQTIPNPVKVAVCLVLTLTIWPKLSLPAAAFPAHPLGLALVLLGEVIMGMTLGMVVNFIFAGIQTGGGLLGTQMGFTMVTLADPSTSEQTTVTSYFLNMVAMLIFLMLDGHLHLLNALSDSFALVPPGGLTINAPLTSSVIELSAGIFVLALKVAAPVMASLLLVELALALMGRAAPQMNLLTMGFPIKIAVGFFFMGILFTIISTLMEDLIMDLGPLFHNLMRMGG